MKGFNELEQLKKTMNDITDLYVQKLALLNEDITIESLNAKIASKIVEVRNLASKCDELCINTQNHKIGNQEEKKFVPLSEAQLRTIRQRLPDGAWRKVCTSYGVRSLEQLSKDDAHDIISRMFASYEKKKYKARAKRGKIE